MEPWAVALRSLIRRPGYTATAILMLTLGIGASTGTFAIVDAILWKALPYPAADRLVTVLEASPAKNKKESLIAPARLEDWNRMNQTFEAIAGSYAENVTDTSGPEPERLAGRRVSPRFFDMHGTAPLIGRTFVHDEEVDGGPGAVVISYGLWTRRYGQDPGVCRKRLVLGGKGCTIAGVMPNEFAAPSVDLWLPAQLNAGLMRIREARFYSGIGRMKLGVTIPQAQADLARVERQLGEMYPQSDKDWSALVGDLKEFRVGNHRRTLLLLFGAVGLLLLIAVANIASLSLAQLNQRERELAIRSSLGGSRWALLSQVMRETALIAIAGAALGAAVGVWAVRLAAAVFANLPRIPELHFDSRPLGSPRLQAWPPRPFSEPCPPFRRRAQIWLCCSPNPRAPFPADAAGCSEPSWSDSLRSPCCCFRAQACCCAATTT